MGLFQTLIINYEITGAIFLEAVIFSIFYPGCDQWQPKTQAAISEAIVPVFVAISVSGTILSESLFVSQLHKNRGRT